MKKLITQLRILKEMNLKPNYSALAREYGCDMRTVKKYNEGYSGGGKIRNQKSKLDKYIKIISVYEFLIDKFGFENVGTYSDFHAYVVKHKFLVNKNNSKTVRFKTNFNVLSFELGNSRYIYYEYRKEKTREDVFECLINAFKFIGGVPHKIIFDNMATVVDRLASTYRAVVINKKFAQFAKDVGFVVNTCKPYRPQTKGKVECVAKLMDRLKVI